MEEEAPWLIQKKIRYSNKFDVSTLAKSLKTTAQKHLIGLKATLDFVVNPPVYQGMSSSIV
jgi:hypothetical protein